MATFLNSLRLAAALAGFACLAACGSSHHEPTSPDLRREHLIALVLPGWTPSGPGQIQTVDLPEPGQPKSPTRARVTPTHVVRLAEDRAVMLATLQPVDQHGEVMGGHAQGAQLGAWWFKRHGETWVADGSEHGFASSGSFGEAGELGVVELAPQRYALSVVDGWTGQGYNNRVLNLYELGRDKVVSLTPGNVKLDADNSGACPARADKATGKLIPEQDAAPDLSCFDVSSTWRVTKGAAEPGELTLEIKSRIDGPERNGPYLERHEKRERLTYRYIGGKYVPERENPVPDI